MYVVYGMTLGFPTIVIPAIQGGEGREPSDIVLNKDEISWFSKFEIFVCFLLTEQVIIYLFLRFYKLDMCAIGVFIFWFIDAANWEKESYAGNKMKCLCSVGNSF